MLAGGQTAGQERRPQALNADSGLPVGGGLAGISTGLAYEIHWNRPGPGDPVGTGFEPLQQTASRIWGI